MCMSDMGPGKTISGHEELGRGVRMSRTRTASAEPMAPPFGGDCGRGAWHMFHRRPCLLWHCSSTAGAKRGPRWELGQCAGWYVCVRRPCGLMDKALVFGTKDCRLESCQGHMSGWHRANPSAKLGLGACWRQAPRMSVKPAGLYSLQGCGVSQRENATEVWAPPPAAHLAARWRVHARKPIGPSRTHHVTWRVPLVS